MRFTLCLILLTLFSCYTQSQNRVFDARSNRPPAEPGKCYQKSQLPTEVLLTDEKYAVYTGKDLTGISVKDTSFFVPASKRWVKKKSDLPCRSPNPEDCLVWCLVTEPAINVVHKIMTDTTETSNFVMKRLELGKRKNQVTEWREVVCEKDLTPQLISKICAQLQMLGDYDLNCDSGQFDISMQLALKQYQLDNFLPIGSLNIETLQQLGINSY